MAQHFTNLNQLRRSTHACFTAKELVDEFRVSHVLHRALVLCQHDKGSIPTS